MRYESMPIVRIELDGMKQQILHHLGVLGSEYGEGLSAQIDKAIQSYDWEGEVTRITHAVVTEQIQGYFRHGGGREIIQSAIEEGMSAILRRSQDEQEWQQR